MPRQLDLTAWIADRVARLLPSPPSGLYRDDGYLKSATAPARRRGSGRMTSIGLVNASELRSAR